MNMTLADKILTLLHERPGLDDEEIGDLVGITPFEASEVLRALEAAGMIREKGTA